MPVPRARQPAAEGKPPGDPVPFERVTTERFALTRERGIRVEDTEPAADHDRERQRVQPAGGPHHHAMTLRRPVRHAQAPPLPDTVPPPSRLSNPKRRPARDLLLIHIPLLHVPHVASLPLLLLRLLLALLLH